MRFTLWGKNVCRDALVMSTGITSYLLNQARDAALQGNSSSVSVHEVGLHACIRNQSKAHVYLSARQLLENYASTHAEMSPMDYKAFLPSGRNVFLLFTSTQRICWSGMGVSWATGHLSWGVHLGTTMSSPTLLRPREAAKRPAPHNTTTKTCPPASRA